MPREFLKKPDIDDDNIGSDTNTVKVKIAGKEYELDKNTATIMSEYNKSVASKLNKQSEDIAAMKALLEKGKSSPSKPDHESDDPEADELSELLVLDPKKAIDKIKTKIREEVVTELGNKRKNEDGVKQFWSDFYDEFKDLRDHKGIVESVLGQNFDKWKELNAKEAISKLGKAVNEYLDKIVASKSGKGARSTTKVKDSEEETLDQVLFEGASINFGRSDKGKEDDEAGSLSLTDLIKSRRNKINSKHRGVDNV